MNENNEQGDNIDQLEFKINHSKIRKYLSKILAYTIFSVAISQFRAA